MADNIAEDLEDAVRLKRATELRKLGANWAEIATTCGYGSPAAALRAVGTAMAQATLRAEMTADQMRDEANLRLEYLFGEAVGMIAADPKSTYDENGNEIEGDDRAVRLRAVDEARRLIEAMAKLNGVTAPKDGQTDGVPTIRIIGIDPNDIV